MPGVIDADTHIFEPPELWNYLDKEWYLRRPIVVSAESDTIYKKSRFWMIDGNIFPKSAGKGGFLLGTPTEPGDIERMPDVRARELLDIPGRLDAMDQMKTDVQVIYPTIFLAYVTDDVDLEIALCRAYNRFMAETCRRANGRLRWQVVPPLRSVDASIEEANFGKENGAVGLFFRGIERDRTLGRPLLLPRVPRGSQAGHARVRPYRGRMPRLHRRVRRHTQPHLPPHANAAPDGIP